MAQPEARAPTPRSSPRPSRRGDISRPLMATKLVGEPIGTPQSGFIRVRVRWENFGNTPPRDLRTHVVWQAREDPIPKDFAFPDLNEKGQILQAHPGTRSLVPPRSSAVSTPAIDIPVSIAGKVGKKLRIYMWGWARYRDVFESQATYITLFCFDITHITIQDGNVNLVSAYCPEHNCTDKECDQPAGQAR